PPAPSHGPRNRADELILEWCNDYGLLGLLPVLATSIATDNFRHFRQGGAWFSGSSAVEPWIGGQFERGDQDSVSQLVRSRDNGAVHTLSTVYLSYWSRQLSSISGFYKPWQPLTGTFTPWRPCSRSFWESYGEPIDLIGYWCIVFLHSVDTVSNW